MTEVPIRYGNYEKHIFLCEADDGDFLCLELDHNEPDWRFLFVESKGAGPYGIKGLIGFSGQWSRPWQLFRPSYWKFNQNTCRLVRAWRVLVAHPITIDSVVLDDTNARDLRDVMNRWFPQTVAVEVESSD